MAFAELFAIERVVPSLGASGKRDALRRLAHLAAPQSGAPKPVVVRAVLEAADMPAFGPASGVAFAHAFVPGLRHSLATLARLDPPLNFDAADGTRTDLLVLLLSPAESAGEHLRALAAIARTLRDRGLRERLRAAPDAASMLASLQEACAAAA